ncbi:hypothetical protein [Natranaeroarchaeum sulfidigenes]|uniref:hypothetical protein n=1 Tax=Natranaeroarchaeum sulfidigenes TaxID=2784880 RepID=UPI001EE4EC55|nr:hypothetical protein [Natranaeroarchaeum sulfidigenes]
MTDRETRIGLVTLLATTEGWSLSYVGYLVAPTESLTNAIYLVGLTIGFATVGCWLYFASAYTGRTITGTASFAGWQSVSTERSWQ